MSIIWGALRHHRPYAQNGFAMTIMATARKRDKLAAQLTWLANRAISICRKTAVTVAGAAQRLSPGLIR
jgi:hypothetical protein